jgi:hypothetical protein
MDFWSMWQRQCRPALVFADHNDWRYGSADDFMQDSSWFFGPSAIMVRQLRPGRPSDAYIKEGGTTYFHKPTPLS